MNIPVWVWWALGILVILLLLSIRANAMQKKAIQEIKNKSDQEQQAQSDTNMRNVWDYINNVSSKKFQTTTTTVTPIN